MYLRAFFPLKELTAQFTKVIKNICLSDSVKPNCDDFKIFNGKGIGLVSRTDVHTIMWRTQRVFLTVNHKTSLFNKHTANLFLIRAGANHIVARYVSIYRIISTSCLSLPFAIQATQICIILTCLFIIIRGKMSLDRIK